MNQIVGDAYARRAAAYTERLGSIAAVHPSDLQLVSAWAAEVGGLVLDAGCGPGHWSGHLAARGVAVRGIDQVPAFVETARATHPGVVFEIGTIDALPDDDDTVGGVLAWYSLIHHEPDALHRPLAEFARVLRPGGALLIGFFTGPDIAPFDHAVVTAHRWPPDALAAQLHRAGFEVIETHTRTSAPGGPRPHGAILARLASTR